MAMTQRLSGNHLVISGFRSSLIKEGFLNGRFKIRLKDQRDLEALRRFFVMVHYNDGFTEIFLNQIKDAVTSSSKHTRKEKIDILVHFGDLKGSNQFFSKNDLDLMHQFRKKCLVWLVHQNIAMERLIEFLSYSRLPEHEFELRKMILESYSFESAEEFIQIFEARSSFSQSVVEESPEEVDSYFEKSLELALPLLSRFTPTDDQISRYSSLSSQPEKLRGKLKKIKVFQFLEVISDPEAWLDLLRRNFESKGKETFESWLKLGLTGHAVQHFIESSPTIWQLTRFLRLPVSSSLANLALSALLQKSPTFEESHKIVENLSRIPDRQALTAILLVQKNSFSSKQILSLGSLLHTSQKDRFARLVTGQFLRSGPNREESIHYLKLYELRAPESRGGDYRIITAIRTIGKILRFLKDEIKWAWIDLLNLSYEEPSDLENTENHRKPTNKPSFRVLKTYLERFSDIESLQYLKEAFPEQWNQWLERVMIHHRMLPIEKLVAAPFQIERYLDEVFEWDPDFETLLKLRDHLATLGKPELRQWFLLLIAHGRITSLNDFWTYFSVDPSDQNSNASEASLAEMMRQLFLDHLDLFFALNPSSQEVSKAASRLGLSEKALLRRKGFKAILRKSETVIAPFRALFSRSQNQPKPWLDTIDCQTVMMELPK